MTEQEKAQADQADVKQRLTEDKDTVLHGHRIVTCHGAADGSLKKLLEDLSTEAIHENDFKNFKRIYSGLTNNSKCACGSGARYEDCCKKTFRLLERAHNNRKKLAAEDKKKEAALEADLLVAIRVEFFKDGTMRTGMLENDAEPISPFEMERLLQEAWTTMNRTNTLQLAARQLANLIQASRNPNNLGKTPGGIITPGP